LKFYLYSVEKQVVISEDLLPKGDFDKSYYILPISKTSGDNKGYTLNVETRALGKIKSENLITVIEFYPVAHQYTEGPTPIENNLSIGRVQKYGTWAYKVDLQSIGTYGPADVQGDGLIQLGQGYEPGWLGFIISQSQSESVKTSFNRLQHVKVNGWANGWIIGSDQSESVATGQSQPIDSKLNTDFKLISTVYLFYWPQLLEWGGVALGAGLTLLLFKLYLRK
jgi:hypothetical protein